MKNALTIALLDLKKLWKDPGAIVQMIIFPVIFTYVFGNAFGSVSNGISKTPVIIENNDTGTLGSQLIDLFSSEDISVVSPEDAGERISEFHHLTIPDNFTEKLFSDPPVKIQLLVPDKAPVMRSESIKIAFYRAQIKVLALLSRTKPESPVAWDDPEFQKRWTEITQEPDLIQTITEVATQREKPPSGMEHQLPGNIVMFVLMVLLVNSAVYLVSERKDGSFRRLLAAPLTPSQILTGKMLGRVLPSLLQVVLLFATGVVLFKLNLKGTIPALALLSIAYCYCASAMGLAMGMWLDNRNRVVAVGVPVTLALAALGGCWWPLEIVGPTMQTLGMAVPTGWAMRGFHEIISFGYGVSAVTDNIALLIVLGTFFIWGASRRVCSAS